MGRYEPGIIGSSGGDQRFLGQGREFVTCDARMIKLLIETLSSLVLGSRLAIVFWFMPSGLR